ncbi:11874_t:CDS:1, partial [Cetraspora pellucida]
IAFKPVDIHHAALRDLTPKRQIGSFQQCDTVIANSNCNNS